LQVAETEVTEEAAACTVIVASPDTARFCTLVAVTITAPAAAGAVKRPVGLMVPALADHVTEELKLPVPCTFALHWEIWLVTTVDGLQVTETEVTVEAGAACTVIIATPEMVGFCTLVAVTMTGPAAAGAVKRPVGLMVPTLADHVTEELKLPVP
jgi:hypothetical protein